MEGIETKGRHGTCNVLKFSTNFIIKLDETTLISVHVSPLNKNLYKGDKDHDTFTDSFTSISRIPVQNQQT